MKTKYLLLGMAALLVAGGVWVGRAAWRAHRQLVTLNVRNARLAEVLRKIERQTWNKIRAENFVANVRVTLHVTDKPLTDVLDRLADQAGARWSTLHAVYGSKRALKALDSALRGDGKIEPAGWTKIAPNLPDFDKPGAREAGPRFPPNPNPGAQGPRPRPPGQGHGLGGVAGPGPRGSMPGKGGTLGGMAGPNGRIFFQGDPNGQMEIWSPEELVMESSLRPRLGNDGTMRDIAVTAASAAETARKVNGRWTSFRVLRKSSMGVGFKAMTPPRPGLSSPSIIEPGPDPSATLTPEQRVQRAREHVGEKEK